MTKFFDEIANALPKGIGEHVRKHGDSILAEVRSNQAKLDECQGPHDFQCTKPERPFGARYECLRCGGEVTGVDAHWYEQGLEHGRKLA